MGAEEKRKKTKLFLVLRPGPDGPNASGWYRLRETISTVTAIFPWVNNLAFNYYSRPRF